MGLQTACHSPLHHLCNRFTSTVVKTIVWEPQLSNKFKSRISFILCPFCCIWLFSFPGNKWGWFTKRISAACQQKLVPVCAGQTSGIPSSLFRLLFYFHHTQRKRQRVGPFCGPSYLIVTDPFKKSLLCPVTTDIIAS